MTAVSQETDQSFGPFQSAIRTNLQLLIDERICKDAPRTLSPWIVGLVVFGGCDSETGLIVASAFEKGLGTSRSCPTQKEMHAEPKGEALNWSRQ